MLTLGIALSPSAILVAVLVGVLIYAVGVYVLHAPTEIVGIVAFVMFLLVLLGGGSIQ